MANTTQDILMSELLTDLGKLHELVTRLESGLSGQLWEWNQVVERLESVRKALEASPDAYRLGTSSERRSGLSESPDALVREIVEAIRSELACSVSAEVRTTSWRLWPVVISGLVGALVTTFVWVAMLRPDSDEPRMIELGRATARAWARLDSPSRSAIAASFVADR